MILGFKSQHDLMLSQVSGQQCFEQRVYRFQSLETEDLGLLTIVLTKEVRIWDLLSLGRPA